MAPITAASNDETHAALLDQLDMHKIHKSFRNTHYKTPQRRNKNLKQILSEASRREQQQIQQAQQAQATSTPGDNPTPAPPIVQPSSISNNQLYSWTSIAAAPSFKPKQKYCDITGLPTTYVEPKSGLRYCNKEIYAIVKSLGTSAIQEYLAARGAHTVLK